MERGLIAHHHHLLVTTRGFLDLLGLRDMAGLPLLESGE